MSREKPRVKPPLLREGGDAFRQAHHKRPKLQEKKVGKSIGGRRQSMSGSHPDAKGDVRRDDEGFPLLVECKRSMGKLSIRVEARWLAKITDEAIGQGRFPALALQFDTEVMTKLARERARPPASEDWIAVPLTTFQAMLEALGEEGIVL